MGRSLPCTLLNSGDPSTVLRLHFEDSLRSVEREPENLQPNCTNSPFLHLDALPQTLLF